MARIEIPADLLEKIGPKMKIDCHWIDVRLNDGKVVTNLVVRGGRFITGHASALNGESELRFRPLTYGTLDVVLLWGLYGRYGRRRMPLTAKSGHKPLY